MKINKIINKKHIITTIGILALIGTCSFFIGKISADVMTIGYLTESRRLVYLFTLQHESFFNVQRAINDSSPERRAIGYMGLIGMKKANGSFLEERLRSEKEPYLKKILIDGILRNIDKDAAINILFTQFESEKGEMRLFILERVKKIDSSRLKDFLTNSDEKTKIEFEKNNEIKFLDMKLMF